MNILSLFPSLDWFVLFLFVLTIILHLVFIKRSRLFADLVAVYISFALVIIVPLFHEGAREWLATHQLYRIAAFVGAVAVLHILFWHSNIGVFSSQVRPMDFATALVYRIAVVGLVFSSILFFAPESIREQLGPLSEALFTNFITLGIWFFWPLILAFAYRHRTKNGWIE